MFFNYLKVLLIYAFLQTNANAAAAAPAIDDETKQSGSVDDDYVQPDEHVLQLANINTLKNHCRGNRCGGFDYGDTDKIAFFDLQTEVRIAPDGKTYDIGPTSTTLSNSDVLIFVNSTFANFPLNLFYALELSELDLRNCGVQHVSWEAFLMANKLTILLLSDNAIKRIDEMTFNYASELQYLFMRNNKLRELDAKSFNGLRKLRHLDLSENRLRELPNGVFDDLPALQELNLAGNRLRVIDNALFAQNAQLLTVTLHTNRLRELGENAFAAQTKLIAVDVSHNHQLDAIVLNLMSARFVLAANCSLYRVNLYGSVMNVDLRDNHVMELYFSEPEKLVTLVLRNNALQQIASLSRATRLDFLDLADNPDLGEALPNPWQADALERLDLSNTSLKALPIDSLVGLPKLRNLNVSNNQIKEINPLNFKHLEKLTHFYINANDWNCYSLNTFMDLLIKPFGISYTIDNFDIEFPGEYVNGIACMYRAETIDYEGDSYENQLSNNNKNLITTTTPSATAGFEKLSMDPAMDEIKALRNELKAIVGIYDQKFDLLFDQLKALQAKMSTLENLNNTLWKEITITV